MSSNPLSTQILTRGEHPQTCVIWLHGLGADSHDFVDFIDHLHCPNGLRLVLPDAPKRPVTLNSGIVMPAWYDIFGLSGKSKEDDIGIPAAAEHIHRLIDEQIAAGFQSQHIFLGGFSQGGALALYSGLRYAHPLAGVIGLSCYLPLNQTTPTATPNSPPILMMHGTLDPVVSITLGETSAQKLQSHAYDLSWQTFAIDHGINREELVALNQWLEQRIVETLRP